nr:hypothetical protein [Tanacetum cinerariifolium]
YPEYLASSDDEAPLEDQPLPADASPTAASPGYMTDSDPEEDPEEDLEEDPEEDPEDYQDDYPTDRGDGDDEPSDGDKDNTDNEDPEEEPFEENNEEEEAPSSGRLSCREPLGYRAVGIRMRALLSSTSRRTDIPEADMPPRKRACLTAPGFEIGESSAAGAARQPGTTKSLTLGDARVTELDSTVRQRTDEFEVRFKDAQFDRALLRARVNTLYRDRPDHHRTAMLMDREAMYSREAWAFSMNRSSAMAAHVRTLETQVAALITQTTSLKTQLTTALGRIEVLEARDPEPQSPRRDQLRLEAAASLAPL